MMRKYFARVLIHDLENHLSLEGKKVLDVGGAGGEFCDILYKKRCCQAFNLDPKPDRCIWPNTKIGQAQKIPFKNNVFDLTICRAVLEHIPSKDQQKSINEIYRVTKKNGLAYLSIPPKYNPHAGHELKPFHYLPFKQAKFFRKIIFRNQVDGDSWEKYGLFPITFNQMLKMINQSGFKILATKDEHLRFHFLTKIPLLRELLVPSVAFILRKPKTEGF